MTLVLPPAFAGDARARLGDHTHKHTHTHTNTHTQHNTRRCYVAKDNLDATLDKFRASGGAAEVEINWKPFFIDPGTKATGEDYLAYCRRRWGGDGWTMSLPGKSQGTKFKGWKVWPNTLHAARLIHRAGVIGGWAMQHKAKGIIFRLVYEDGANVSEMKTLVAAAAEIGIPDAKAYLESDEDMVLVQKQAREASRMGITGVPFFVAYNSKEEEAEPITLSGAQPPKAFAQCLAALAKA